MYISSLTSGYSNAQLSASSIQRSSSRLQAVIANLVSGSRLTKASSDIAALSISTQLQAQLSGLRQASGNVAQASSLLQVADGGISQISSMVERMQALAVQANSGALSQSGREGLNREFQQLREQIDSMAGSTRFNGVNLLDGSISNGGNLQTDTVASQRAVGSLTFSGNIGAGQTININGATLTEGVDFNAGGTIQATLDNLTNALNSSTDPRVSQASFSRVGNSINIEAKAAGSIGNQFIINEGASTAAAAFSVNGNQLGASSIFSLQGGVDNGISGGSVAANGSVTNSLVTGLSNTPASTTLNFTSTSDIQAGDTVQIDDGNGGFVTFNFVAGTPASATDIQIGSTVEQTLQNAATTLNSYTGNNDFGIRQLNFSVNGNSLEVTAKDGFTATDALGAALNVNLGTTGGTITNTTLNNGSTGGINTSGVTNAAFAGTIQGFSATRTGADQVTATIKVGDETYTATISDTTPTANSTVRFTSENGGFFDVQLAANQGESVTTQADADRFADRLDAAFAGVNFTQTREISNFNPQGQLVGATLSATGNDFSNLKVQDVKVTVPVGSGSDAVIEFNVGGQIFRSEAGLGSSIGAGESVTLRSLTDPTRSITFTNGENAINLRVNNDGAQLETALEKALGNGGSSGISFQVGDNSSDLAKVSIGSLKSDQLFGKGSLDLLSAANASAAFMATSNALDALSSTRADVGAFQQSLDYASANLASAIFNMDAARATLADSDIVSDSTEFALALLQNNASIAMAAQSRRIPPSMLRLIQ